MEWFRSVKLEGRECMEDNKKPNDEKLDKSESKKTLGEFVNEIVGEFKKIVWPNRKDLMKQTATVIVTSLIIGVIIFGMDTVFGFTYSSIVRLLG